MVEIPDEAQKLLDQPVLYNLATVNPNGSVQVNPVWGDVHDGYIRLNTAAGRQKHKNFINRGEHVTIMVQDPEDTQHYIEIRGRVSELTEEDGDEVIDLLARKYTGDEYDGHVPGQTRVTVMIEPTRVFLRG